MAFKMRRNPVRRGISKIEKVGDWAFARLICSGFENNLAVHAAFVEASVREAHLARALLIKGLVSGAPAGKAFKPQSAWTAATRIVKGTRGAGASKPLIASGTFLRNINVKRIPEGAFVGVLRSAKGADGQSLVDTAYVNEYGKRILIPTSPAMMALIFQIGAAMDALFGTDREVASRRKGVKAGYIVVRIPARPLFRPIWRKYFTKTKVRERVFPFIAARILRGGALQGASSKTALGAKL